MKISKASKGGNWLLNPKLWRMLRFYADEPQQIEIGGHNITEQLFRIYISSADGMRSAIELNRSEAETLHSWLGAKLANQDHF